MTAIEVFHEITNEPKWYAGFTTPQKASNIKARFNAKTLEFKTLEDSLDVAAGDHNKSDD